jgi:hypothetical protein
MPGLSTLVTTAQPGVATQIAAIHWNDYGADAFNTAIRVTTATTIGNLAAIAQAANVFSQGHICEDGGLELAGLSYNVTGELPATNALFARKTDYLEFEFRSRAYCSARVVVQVPSPSETAIDPANVGDPATNIFADSTGGERNVNLTHPAIAAFVALVAAHIAIAAYNVADWYCVNGERVTSSVSYAGKRAS